MVYTDCGTKSCLHYICAMPSELIRASIRYIMHVVVATSCQYAEAYYLSTITIMWDRPDMSTNICEWWLISMYYQVLIKRPGPIGYLNRNIVILNLKCQNFYLKKYKYLLFLKIGYLLSNSISYHRRPWCTWILNPTAQRALKSLDKHQFLATKSENLIK